ncbi:cation diffusion facilitator family transporter [Lactococcus insecticola]|uniref:Cation transporter n=1 Tax=Pseudolactococcus insecticola TaxID=2709158 RepID=A0A6A0B5R9_9LACT|nr:cation diffusion facilitator family transporter [Lactococcus insecticola]GFH40740.1 cation transporter [Lactococcus insecticola]
MSTETENSSGMGSVIAALGANVLVAISKFIGFAISGSSAMMNESIHSVVDCGNQILLLFGDKRAKAETSELHPFGEARAKYFFSTIVAMMLFFGGGALGVIEAVEKLTHPAHEISNTWLVIAILIFGLVVESTSLRVAFKEIAELNVEQQPLFKFLRESRHSEVLIIFTEDSCAVVGLLLALAGTVLSHVTGNAFWDAFSGLLIGLLLMAAAIFLAKEFYSLLVGESATKADLAKIKSSFSRPEVDKLIDLKTVHLGPTDILVAAKIDVADDFDAKTFDLINDIESQIRTKLAGYKTYIYIETDTFDENYQAKS